MESHGTTLESHLGQQSTALIAILHIDDMGTLDDPGRCMSLAGNNPFRPGVGGHGRGLTEGEGTWTWRRETGENYLVICFKGGQE